MKHLRCAACRELKPPDCFARTNNNISGRRGICLTCAPETPPPPKPQVPPNVAQAMCGKKHRYGSKGTALVVALRSARRTSLMRVYECPICEGWHLTHKPERTSA